MVVRTLRKKAAIVPQTSWTKSARKLFAPSHSAEDISAVAEDVGAQIVITGLVKKRRAALGAVARRARRQDGQDARAAEVSAQGAAHDAATCWRSLAKEVDAAFDSVAGAPAEGKPPVSRGQAAGRAAEAERAAEARAAEAGGTRSRRRGRPTPNAGEEPQAGAAEADGGAGRADAVAVGGGAAAAGGARRGRQAGAGAASALGALLRSRRSGRR